MRKTKKIQPDWMEEHERQIEYGRKMMTSEDRASIPEIKQLDTNEVARRQREETLRRQKAEKEYERLERPVNEMNPSDLVALLKSKYEKGESVDFIDNRGIADRARDFNIMYAKLLEKAEIPDSAFRSFRKKRTQ